MRVLVTGAAGFIGGAVLRALDEAGHEVVGVDAYIPQAHGRRVRRSGDIAWIDIREGDRIEPLLPGVDVVCHQSAMVGAGVTVADLPLYAGHNDLGTATLLAAMASAGVGRMVLASSMVVYGDGRYTCPEHGERPARARTVRDLELGRFEVTCPVCGRAMTWLLVDEDAPLRPQSGYAASKVAQEHYATAWARQSGGSVVALRYHNVYGPLMPADTPYSGVAAMFRSALEHGEPPRVFEDGRQMRDFVHVGDVAVANLRAVDLVASRQSAGLSAYNVCSGTPTSIADVARLIGRGVAGPAVDAIVTGDFRAGDVRHIVASAEKARRELGFAARVSPADGLGRFATDPMRPTTTSTSR